MATRRRPMTFILLVSFVLTLVVVPPQASGQVVDTAEADACCSHAQEPADRGEPCGSSSPADDDCCPGGCDHCALACCFGLVSSLAIPVILDHDVTSISVIAQYDDACSSAHPGEIAHPPRR